MLKDSEHFTIDEIINTSWSQSMKEANRKSLEFRTDLHRNISELQLFLEYIRKFPAQNGTPIIITSGYRCPALNGHVGGSSTSRHLLGLAADWHYKNKQIKNISDYWKEPFIEYLCQYHHDGYVLRELYRYPHRNFFHVSLFCPVKEMSSDEIYRSFKFNWNKS